MALSKSVRFIAALLLSVALLALLLLAAAHSGGSPMALLLPAAFLAGLLAPAAAWRTRLGPPLPSPVAPFLPAAPGRAPPSL